MVLHVILYRILLMGPDSLSLNLDRLLIDDFKILYPLYTELPVIWGTQV